MKSQFWRMLAIVCAAVIVATLGLIITVRVNGPGSLLATAQGRWLAERIAPANNPAGTHAIIEGELVGSLTLTDIDGHLQGLPNFHGRRTLVNVWASWCKPCRDEMPLLSAFAKPQSRSGIAVVGIAEDDAASVRSYLLLTPVIYPILFDNAQGSAGIRLGNRLGALPYTALIDANGRLVRRKYGPFSSERDLAEWATAP